MADDQSSVKWLPYTAMRMSQYMNAGDVNSFSRVASTLSYSRAADQIGVSRSTVSKSVSRLEKSLGVSLLRRNTRGLTLTEAGRTFFMHVREAEEVLSRAIDSIRGADEVPRGNISCSITPSLGAALMSTFFSEIRAMWPELRINLSFDERYVSLVSGGFDVGIRIAEKLQDSNLKSRRIGTTRQILVASPGYLARHGTPKHVSELPSHCCLDISHVTQYHHIWQFDEAGKAIDIRVGCATTSNSYIPLISAACMDEGIMYIPDISISSELAQGRLQPILSEFCDTAPLGIYAIHTYNIPPMKVRVFIDFVKHSLQRLSKVNLAAMTSDQANTNR